MSEKRADYLAGETNPRYTDDQIKEAFRFLDSFAAKWAEGNRTDQYYYEQNAPIVALVLTELLHLRRRERDLLVLLAGCTAYRPETARWQRYFGLDEAAFIALLHKAGYKGAAILKEATNA